MFKPYHITTIFYTTGKVVPSKVEDEPRLNTTIEERVALLEIQVRISGRKVLFLRMTKHCFDLQRTVCVFKRSVPSS